MPDSASLPRISRRPLRPGRRAVLGAGAAGLLLLGSTACGRVRLGSPASYTPPPEGIDDLYRADLQAAIAQAQSACTAAQDLVSAHGDLADYISESLAQQAEALLTGAEAEDEASASASASSSAPASDGGGADSGDAAALVAALVALRDLCTQAARQISGSLARPVTAIGAWCAWASARIAALLPESASALTDAPTTDDLAEGTRDVPADDPPSVGAQSDFHATIETAQTDEWYTGYCYEVLAARTAGAEREAHQASCDAHRARAAQLAAIAEAEDAPVVVREAVYPLPTAFADAAGIAGWPATSAHDLLITHLALVGASPFEDRPVPIVAALEEAARLATATAALEPVPSIDLG